MNMDEHQTDKDIVNTVFERGAMTIDDVMEYLSMDDRLNITYFTREVDSDEIIPCQDYAADGVMIETKDGKPIMEE
jgi:hypothetical protein